MRCGLLCILVLVICSCQGFAQKAYEIIRYTGKLQDKIVRLDLADGYIGASKISFFINPKQKPQVFLPESGVAGAPFILRNTRQVSKDYFILNKMQDAFEQIPAVITGLYRSDKRSVTVKFYLVK